MTRLHGNGWGQGRALSSAVREKRVGRVNGEQKRELQTGAALAVYLVEEEGDARDPSAETPAASAGAGGGEAGRVEAPGELDDVVPRRGRRRHDQHPGARKKLP